MTRVLLAVLLIATIGFGFFKQVRTAVRSRHEYAALHPEPGERSKKLRNDLERKFFAVQIEKMKLGYFSDSKERPRPTEEYLYDAQYGIAPYHFNLGDKSAEVIVAE